MSIAQPCCNTVHLYKLREYPNGSLTIHLMIHLPLPYHLYTSKLCKKYLYSNMFIHLSAIKVVVLVLLHASTESASATKSELEASCSMLPWGPDAPRTHLTQRQIIGCLQLPSEQVHPTFKSIYYLENVPAFAGGIQKDNIKPQELYDAFVRGDILAKFQIQTALRRLYAEDLDKPDSVPAEFAAILSFKIN